MRKALILFCIAILATHARAQDIKKLTIKKQEIKSPEIKKWKITDLQAYIRDCDHPLIVNFWATFCVPCLKEVPYFESTAARYKDQGVELLMVSLDLPDYYPARIAAFAKKNGITARIVWLDETDADYFCPKVSANWSGGIPASLFVNNLTHYSRFFDRQLTEPQVGQAIEVMTTISK